MRRILLEIEYTGTNYAGWQRRQTVWPAAGAEETLSRASGRQSRTGASRTGRGRFPLGQAVPLHSPCSNPPTSSPLYQPHAPAGSSSRTRDGMCRPPCFTPVHDCGKRTPTLIVDRHGSPSCATRTLRVLPPIVWRRVVWPAARSLVPDFAAFQATGGTARTLSAPSQGGAVACGKRADLPDRRRRVLVQHGADHRGYADRDRSRQAGHGRVPAGIFLPKPA